MFIRGWFVLQRFFGYAVVFAAQFWHPQDRPWWQWGISLIAWIWGSSEHLKRPDALQSVMRYGVWIEAALIAAWAGLFYDPMVLFLWISPVARTGIHLERRDNLVLCVVLLACIMTASMLMMSPGWVKWVQSAVIIGTTGYSLVLGELIRQRDRLSRAVRLTAFDREQRVKDEERVRMAGQLHDTMGQYWTGVIRALDVAQQVTGEQKQLFIDKARSAAMEGLAAMRTATHTWHDGRQTPGEWLQYAEAALRRLSEFVGLDVQFRTADIQWERFSDRLKVAELLARTMIESATNAIRHGAANRLVVTLQSDDAEVRLVVRDDGRGFAGVQKDEHEGIGIASLRSFAQEEGGSLTLESGRGRGTTLVLRVPYVSEEQIHEWGAMV